MKVKGLISKLKKMNPDAEVIIQDHDHRGRNGRSGRICNRLG